MIDEFDVCLMDECCRLERVPGAFGNEERAGEGFELVIDDGRELDGGVLVAAGQVLEQSGCCLLPVLIHGSIQGAGLARG